MLDKMLNNPAILLIALAIAIVGVAEGVATIMSVFNKRSGDDINKLLNSDHQAMDELHQRVKDLKKKEQ